MVTLEVAGKITVEIDSDTAENAVKILKEHPELAKVVSVQPSEIEEL